MNLIWKIRVYLANKIMPDGTNMFWAKGSGSMKEINMPTIYKNGKNIINKTRWTHIAIVHGDNQ